MAEDQDTRQAQRDDLMASSQHAFLVLSQDGPPPSLGALTGSAAEGRAAVQPSGGRRLFRRPMPSLSPPPPGKWPSEMQGSSRSKPTGQKPRRLPLIEEWLAAYEVEGRHGLEKSFYNWAQLCLKDVESRNLDGWSKSNEKRSWGLLLKDKEQGAHIVACLLGLLPDKIILALLRGELPLKCKEDHEVRRFVFKFMQLDETPGIYVNLLDNHEYRWLSSQDIEALIAKLERYIEVEPSGLPRADQTAVDIRHSNWTPGPNDSKIRWLQGQPGGRPELIIQEWIDTVKQIYCQNPTDVTTAFRMGPAEVGWASNTKARCRQHWNNSSTTYLFGLLNAICRISRPSSFAFPEPMQLVLFPIRGRDEMMCRIGEVVGSMLCSSYWYLGGLNCFHAGTIVWHEEDGTRSEAELRPVSSKKLCWVII